MSIYFLLGEGRSGRAVLTSEKAKAGVLPGISLSTPIESGQAGDLVTTERLKQMGKLEQRRWLRLVFYVAILIGLSVVLAYLLKYLVAHFDIPIQRLGPLAYLAVFGITLAANAAILIPVYFHVSIMITVAKMMTEVSPWGFVLVALVASVVAAQFSQSAANTGYESHKNKTPR